MAKDKVKGAKGVPNKHLHARVAYLHQAASHLASPQTETLTHGDSSSNATASTVSEAQLKAINSSHMEGSSTEAVTPVQSSGLSQYLSSQLRQVALKAQIRLDSSVKRSFCKTCSTILVDGETCLKYMENLSRGGRKPHADILVLECMTCGTKKRFPTMAMRQRKKSERKQTSALDTGKAAIPPPE